MAGYEDCVYHGIPHRFDTSEHRGEDVYTPARIMVENPEKGPTQRERVCVLRELFPFDDTGDFGWGHNGGGTSRAAAAMLADALGIEHERIAFVSDSTTPLFNWLREDFCEDVLGQCCDEWRLRRGAILRWIRGWYSYRGVAELPELVATLPPIHFDPELDAALDQLS